MQGCLRERAPATIVQGAHLVRDPVAGSVVAENLPLAAEAAAFLGWQPGDLPSLHDWIGDLTGTRPPSLMVSGYKRLGFLLFDLRRFPMLSGVATTMKVTLTDKALDGTPLDRGGRPLTDLIGRP
jgi:hypothetical protein